MSLEITTTDKFISSEILIHLFGNFGAIDKFIRHNDQHCTVTYHDERDAEDAKKDLNGMKIGSITIKIEWTEAQPIIDRNTQHVPLRLIIADLPQDANIQEITKELSKFGTITSVKYVLEVTYADERDCEDAVKAYKGSTITATVIHLN